MHSPAGSSPRTSTCSAGSIVIAIVGGLASLVIAAEGAMRFNIGVLIWITTMIAFGIMVSMFGIVTERKERALLFVLSLPLSHGDYVRIKLLALLAIYLPGWLVLSAGAVTLLLVMPNLPDGLIPYTVLLCVYFLANFAVVLCGALHTHSEGAMTALIVVTNMCVSLFIFMVGAISSIHDHLPGRHPDLERRVLDGARNRTRRLRSCALPALPLRGPPPRFQLKGFQHEYQSP